MGTLEVVMTPSSKPGTSDIIVPLEGATLEAWTVTRAALLDFVARRVESRDAAEDIVQDVLEHLARSAGVANVKAWLYRAARNAIIDHYRRRRRPAEPLEAAETLAAPEVEPDFGPAVAELAACLRPMIDQLPGEYRAALVAVDLEGVTQVEAARAVGLSVSGMKSRVQRGRRRLAELVDACCSVQLSPTGAIEGYIPRTGCCRAEPLPSFLGR